MIVFLQTLPPKTDGPRQKRKFSTYFKSLVIELDRELYGPDNHLVEVSKIAVTKFLFQGTKHQIIMLWRLNNNVTKFTLQPGTRNVTSYR